MYPTPGSPTPFDAQAAELDRRVGLPEADCRAIAATVLALGQSRSGDQVVEIGAGTGMIGRWFLDHPVRYVGIDLSRGMLEMFRRRAARACLIQADAAQPWPIPDGVIRVVFSSRAIHLLPPEHVASEVLRISLPGATCVLGWVERRPDSIKARMSREMQRRLRDRGFAVRSAGGRRVLEALLGRRGSDLDTPPPGSRGRGGAASIRTVAARWPARHTPRQALDDWSSKKGLGGIVLPPGVQAEVLRELAAWAEETFGGLDAARSSEEEYVLESVRLPG